MLYADRVANYPVMVYADGHETVAEFLARDYEVGYGGKVEQGRLLVWLRVSGLDDGTFRDLMKYTGT